MGLLFANKKLLLLTGYFIGTACDKIIVLLAGAGRLTRTGRSEIMVDVLRILDGKPKLPRLSPFSSSYQSILSAGFGFNILVKIYFSSHPYCS